MDIPLFNTDWEEQDHKVIQSLYRLEKEKPKELRHKIFQVNGENWTSWTMRDSLYKKNRYPTQARGFFTSTLPNGRYTVNIRGYDKFFNVNEADITQWNALEKDTMGPYEITAKENGCIIFVAATASGELIATSKHSIPEPKDNSSHHGGVGYRWLVRHLTSVERTPEELAAWLSNYRVTLVAELCDDEFEEHVVPYRIKRGLYLHGINYNTTTLHTLPTNIVKQVSKRFGFHTIDAKLVKDMSVVRKMAEDIQQDLTGKFNWMNALNDKSYNETHGDHAEDDNDRESEGIVVRCQRNEMDFFFKVKNDTYLVYREYREVTKALVEVKVDKHDLQRYRVEIKPTMGKGGKKVKIRFEKTLYYIRWLLERIKDRPEWFKEYSNNKGIVAVRQAFEKDWEEGKLVHLDSEHDLRYLVERDTRQF